jgi:hypothetical protein
MCLLALAGAIFGNAGGTAAGHLLLKASAAPFTATSLAQQLFLHSLQAAFLVSAGIAALGVLVALGRGKERLGISMPEKHPVAE